MKTQPAKLVMGILERWWKMQWGCRNALKSQPGGKSGHTFTAVLLLDLSNDAVVKLRVAKSILQEIWERERREDEDNLQDRQGLQVDYRLTFLGQCHLVLTFLVFSKFLEWKQTNETLQLLTGAPKSGLLKCFRLNTSGVVIDHNYCHDWVNHNVT